MAWIRRQVKKWKGGQMKKSEAKKQPQGLSSNALACKNKHGLRLALVAAIWTTMISLKDFQHQPQRWPQNLWLQPRRSLKTASKLQRLLQFIPRDLRLECMVLAISKDRQKGNKGCRGRRKLTHFIGGTPVKVCLKITPLPPPPLRSWPLLCSLKTMTSKSGPVIQRQAKIKRRPTFVLRGQCCKGSRGKAVRRPPKVAGVQMYILKRIQNILRTRIQIQLALELVVTKENQTPITKVLNRVLQKLRIFSKQLKKTKA